MGPTLMGVVCRLVRKYLLTLEIVSKQGVTHFQRFRLLQTAFFSVYLHRILAADREAHAHSHPWAFWGIILWNGYTELLDTGHRDERGFLSARLRRHSRYGPTWSLVVVGPRYLTWGYQTEDGFCDIVA